ncbi:uncharacterized protein J4E87_003281 [Alternaria ethzedia]|uniref:uncharacterized protein n=1 Tax=Alternaria ethzedia TaxID=181014 RepID=UPI0020C1D75C|nr:uncharacterized protein J4E87_003281 [Alternaria ethzedia]KAI4629021.1 hypothetical protein J4E87_003281 [Alternaria ethzedia]
MEEREYQLPACQKCKLRKVKCDRQAPKCTSCRKGNIACIIVDPITGEQYARAYIRQLEEKELSLQRRLGDLDDTGVVTPASTERSDAANQTPTGPETATSSGTQSGFVGDGSGLGFLQNILSDTKWQHHRAQILEQLAKRPRIAKYRPVARALPPPAQAQLLIFWECYVHDRYSSGILGRPFALLESEISMPLPIDADDETIETSGAGVLEEVPNITNVHPSELSVNLFCIKLRRLSSRVHTAFYAGRKPASHHSGDNTRTPGYHSIGHIYSSFSQFDKDLRALRSSVPVFVDPKCLYERTEWHDFMYEKDRLLLARGAMHNLPARQFSGTSIVKEILKACYQSAIHTIQLYADLRSKNAITWTRSYFQMIFTAGLTVIYCIILGVLTDNDELSVTHTEALPTLNTCSALLNYFKDKMPDAGSFATAFTVILAEFVKDRFASALQVSENVPVNPTQPIHQLLPAHDTQVYPNHLLNAGSLHLSVDTITADHSQSVGEQQERVNLDHLMLGDFPDLPNNQGSQDFGMGLTDDLMNQLEYGLGEYAWGSLNTNVDYWDSFSYN